MEIRKGKRERPHRSSRTSSGMGRRCKTRKNGRPARLLPLASSLGRAPGIDDSNAAVGKVGTIPRCKLSPVRPGNGCNLGVRVADGSSKRPAVCCNPCKMLRSVALECEYTSREVFRQHPFRCSQQAVAALTFGEQFDSVKDFRLRDRGRKEVCQRLLGDPYRDSGRRFRPHEFRYHIRIEDDHSSNPGPLRTASRCGKEILIPPNDANRRRIASARFPLVGEEGVKAERKISRASSSIERPWWAARTRKRVLVFWSSCRMVSAAMPAMIALLASDAKRLLSAPSYLSIEASDGHRLIIPRSSASPALGARNDCTAHARFPARAQTAAFRAARAWRSTLRAAVRP